MMREYLCAHTAAQHEAQRGGQLGLPCDYHHALLVPRQLATHELPVGVLSTYQTPSYDSNKPLAFHHDTHPKTAEFVLMLSCRTEGTVQLGCCPAFVVPTSQPKLPRQSSNLHLLKRTAGHTPRQGVAVVCTRRWALVLRCVAQYTSCPHGHQARTIKKADASEI